MLFVLPSLAILIVLTWAYLPVGAPAVEATRHEIRFTAPLTAITAAVVGVVINLAVFFAWHVLWPQASESDPRATWKRRAPFLP